MRAPSRPRAGAARRGRASRRARRTSVETHARGQLSRALTQPPVACRSSVQPEWPEPTPRTARRRFSSTVRPPNERDCWYVRPMPSFARVRGGSTLTSCPRNSTDPDVGSMSPEMTLNNVVFPAPFGPRIARLSPCATSRSTSRTAWRPPNRRPIPRKRRIGSAASASTASGNGYPVTGGVIALPCHGRLFLTHFGKLRPGDGVFDEYVPPNVWSTAGTSPTVFVASLPSFVISCP